MSNKKEVFFKKNNASEFDECCLLSLKREEWVNNQQKHCMNATISELKNRTYNLKNEEFEYFLSSKPQFISYLSKTLFFAVFLMVEKNALPNFSTTWLIHDIVML